MTFSREELIAICVTDMREGVRRSAAEALYAMGQVDHAVDLINLRVAQINPAYLTPQEREWVAEGEKEQV